MWAAGEAEYLQPLVIGQPAQRISTIESVELKSGSTGPLVFVNVRHDILQNGTRCVTQTQNLVYREHPAPDAPQPPAKAAPGDAQWSRTVKPDPVLLFRYSALTYNGHRIHYDRPYALQDEGYPALVVHGPLLVTLILDLLRHSLPDAPCANCVSAPPARPSTATPLPFRARQRGNRCDSGLPITRVRCA